MWLIDYIEIKNIKSHVNTRYTLQQNAMTLICGTIVKEEGADSNGSGKSTMVKAITLALIGLPDRKMAIEDYINNDADEGSVELAMYNTMYRSEIVIKRTLFRSKNKAIKTQVKENGVENKQLIKDSKATDFILGMLNMTKEDLLNYFVINQRNHHSFLSATDSKQKEIISRFSNMGSVNEALDKIKADKTSVEKEISTINIEMEKNEAVMEQLQESLNFEKNQRKADVAERKEGLDEELSSLDEEKLKIKRLIQKKKIALSRLEKPETEVEDCREHIKLIEADIRERKGKIRKLKANILDYESVLEGGVTCPQCEHLFAQDCDLTIEEVQKDLPVLRKRSPTVKSRKNYQRHDRQGINSV
jgi:DNA repair exonuclease SbcCD ATPase subunit